MTPPSPITKLEIPQQRVEARYGTQADFSPPFWNDTIDALLNHRTARAYLPKALPEGSLELLVAAAQSAPTSSIFRRGVWLRCRTRSARHDWRVSPAATPI